MEWYWILLLILGGLLLVMVTGLPVALCFIIINIVGVFLLWHGEDGLRQLTFSMWHTVASFKWLPIPMFVLMGEVVFHSGIGMHAIDALDKWFGRLPGRLSLLAVFTGVVFSTMSGSSTATTCLLGEVLIPEMEKRGYKRVMSVGSILGGGGLAVIIPPSTLMVVWGSLAGVSIAKLLISGIIPGLIMALFYVVYVIGRCWLQPSIAPAYEVARTPMPEKLKDTAVHVFPLSFIVFMVTGLILLGIATPSESAVMGALASLVLAAVYRQLNWRLCKDSIIATARITVMILVIISGAEAFSRILSFTGASREFGTLIVGLPVPPILIVIFMHIVLLMLGCFMSASPIMMITLPIFMPVINALGFDPVWFGLTFVMNLEIGHTTPPFGVQLFAAQGVAPSGTTMKEIILASLPFTISDMLVMFLIVFVPVLATFLPNLLIT